MQLTNLPLEFEQAFPHGAFVISEVTPVSDFDRSTKAKQVQAADKLTGEPVWQVQVMDADPAARKGQQVFTVKIPGQYQPVPPETLAGTPFRPVELVGLTVTPYVDSKTNRMAVSLRATEMRAPGQGRRPRPAPDQAA